MTAFPLDRIRRLLSKVEELAPDDRQVAEAATTILVKLVELPGSDRMTMLEILREFGSLPPWRQSRFLELVDQMGIEKEPEHD